MFTHKSYKRGVNPLEVHGPQVPTEKSKPRTLEMSADVSRALAVILLLLELVVQCAGRGVLSIKLLHFQNKRGRTYEGQCCDPTPLDSATCHDPCDYVMRLIVSGLGRANDHVFLFHRPLKYDSNDLHFERDGGDLTLTILFDRWPSEGHVKMDVFFYDYDDFDHTTALVDWFETELVGEDAGSEGQQQVIVNGNRQSDKTRLEFQWARHCYGAKGCLPPPPEWKLWPWEDTNPKQDPLETGHISNNRGQRVYYQKEYRQGGSIKSPFKPFSTAKHSPEKKGSKGSDSPITPENVVRQVVELPSTMTPSGPTSGEREDQIRQNVDIRSQNFSTRAQNGRAQTQPIPRSPFVQRWRGYQHETPLVRSWDTDRGVSETVLQGRPQDFQETDMVETRASATPQTVRSLLLRPTMSPPKSLVENIRERNRWLSRKGGKGNDSLIDEDFIPAYYKEYSLKDKKFIPTLSGNPEGRNTTLSQVGGVSTTPEPVLKVENERKNDLNNKDGGDGILNSTSASTTVTSLQNYTVSKATGTVQYSPTKNDDFTRSEESDLVQQESAASRLTKLTRNATVTSATTTAVSATAETTIEKSRNVTVSKFENSFIQEGASPPVTVGYTSPLVTAMPTSSQAAVVSTSSPVTVVPTSPPVTAGYSSPQVTVMPRSSQAAVVSTSSPVTIDYTSPQVTVMPTSSQAAVVSTSSPVTVVLTSSQVTIMPTSSQAAVVSTSSPVTVVPTSSPVITMSSLREKTRTAAAISNEYVTYLQGDVTQHLSNASHSSTAGSASALTLETASSMLSPTPHSLRAHKTSPAIVYTRPRGWGPNEKNLFVTWIPNTPAAGWIPSENRASGGTLDEYIDEALMRRNVPHSPIELRVRGQSSDAVQPRDKGVASSGQESSPAVDKVKQWLEVVHQLQEHSNQEEKDRKIAEAGGSGMPRQLEGFNPLLLQKMRERKLHNKVKQALVSALGQNKKTSNSSNKSSSPQGSTQGTVSNKKYSPTTKPLLLGTRWVKTTRPAVASSLHKSSNASLSSTVRVPTRQHSILQKSSTHSKSITRTQTNNVTESGGKGGEDFGEEYGRKGADHVVAEAHTSKLIDPPSASANMTSTIRGKMTRMQHANVHRLPGNETKVSHRDKETQTSRSASLNEARALNRVNFNEAKTLSMTSLHEARDLKEKELSGYTGRVTTENESITNPVIPRSSVTSRETVAVTSATPSTLITVPKSTKTGEMKLEEAPTGKPEEDKSTSMRAHSPLSPSSAQTFQTPAHTSLPHASPPQTTSSISDVASSNRKTQMGHNDRYKETGQEVTGTRTPEQIKQEIKLRHQDIAMNRTDKQEGKRTGFKYGSTVLLSRHDLMDLSTTADKRNVSGEESPHDLSNESSMSSKSVKGQVTMGATSTTVATQKEELSSKAEERRSGPPVISTLTEGSEKRPVNPFLKNADTKNRGHTEPPQKRLTASNPQHARESLATLSERISKSSLKSLKKPITEIANTSGVKRSEEKKDEEHLPEHTEWKETLSKDKESSRGRSEQTTAGFNLKRKQTASENVSKHFPPVHQTASQSLNLSLDGDKHSAGRATLRRTDGRLSSLYTSASNGTKVNSTLLSNKSREGLQTVFVLSERRDKDELGTASSQSDTTTSAVVGIRDSSSTTPEFRVEVSSRKTVQQPVRWQDAQRRLQNLLRNVTVKSSRINKPREKLVKLGYDVTERTMKSSRPDMVREIARDGNAGTPTAVDVSGSSQQIAAAPNATSLPSSGSPEPGNTTKTSNKPTARNFDTASEKMHINAANKTSKELSTSSLSLVEMYWTPLTTETSLQLSISKHTPSLHLHSLPTSPRLSTEQNSEAHPAEATTLGSGETAYITPTVNSTAQFSYINSVAAKAPLASSSKTEIPAAQNNIKTVDAISLGNLTGQPHLPQTSSSVSFEEGAGNNAGNYSNGVLSSGSNEVPITSYIPVPAEREGYNLTGIDWKNETEKRTSALLTNVDAPAPTQKRLPEEFSKENGSMPLTQKMQGQENVSSSQSPAALDSSKDSRIVSVYSTQTSPFTSSVSYHPDHVLGRLLGASSGDKHVTSRDNNGSVFEPLNGTETVEGLHFAINNTERNGTIIMSSFKPNETLSASEKVTVKEYNSSFQKNNQDVLELATPANTSIPDPSNSTNSSLQGPVGPSFTDIFRLVTISSTSANDSRLEPPGTVNDFIGVASMATHSVNTTTYQASTTTISTPDDSGISRESTHSEKRVTEALSGAGTSLSEPVNDPMAGTTVHSRDSPLVAAAASISEPGAAAPPSESNYGPTTAVKDSELVNFTGSTDTTVPEKKDALESNTTKFHDFLVNRTSTRTPSRTDVTQRENSTGPGTDSDGRTVLSSTQEGTSIGVQKPINDSDTEMTYITNVTSSTERTVMSSSPGSSLSTNVTLVDRLEVNSTEALGNNTQNGNRSDSVERLENSTTSIPVTTPVPTTTPISTTTTPKKMILTLPSWLTVEGIGKDVIANKSQSSVTTRAFSPSKQSFTKKPTTSKSPKIIHKTQKKSTTRLTTRMATSSSSKSSSTTTTVPSTPDKETPSPENSKDARVIFPVPAISVLLNGSEVGPKVIVPLRGLFVPGSNVLVNVTEEMTSPQEMTQVSGAGARHVSIRSQSLSVQTVFSRYWPAILGLTVGTMFLVAALMTSLACRQQRLFVQRRQWLDTPQHLTTPPDISEYTSSSSSLTSDNTRSSANFT